MADEQFNNEDFMEEVTYRAPSLFETILLKSSWWFGSAVFHALVLLIMWQIPWGGDGAQQNPITAALVEEKEVIEDEREEIEQLVFDEEPDIVDPNLPAEDVTFVPEVVMEQFDIDVPGFNLLDPDDHPPLEVARVALGDKGPTGHFHGIYGARGGSGRRSSLLRHGGSRRTEESVDEGLAWLARHQEADGSWNSRKWGANRDADAACTGLALLAFLGHGQTDREGRYRQNVRRAMEWLEKNQRSNGSWQGRFYTNGICTMAMSEAYGLTRNPRWGRVAQAALDYCAANQNPNGGWDYNGNNPNRVDTSVTSWVVLAIKSGEASGLNVDSVTIERIKKWCRESLNADGSTGYTKNIGAQGSGGGRPSMTAVGNLLRMFMGWAPEDIKAGLDIVHRTGPQMNNFYYTYYATFGMFQAGGQYWADWNRRFRDPMIEAQVKGRGLEFDGSWDPTVQYGGYGGRVYSTAMAVFMLEVYYRYMPILR